MSARNDWIDVLRAFSALGVTLFHFNVFVEAARAGKWGAAWHWFWLHGHLGVPVFFALSGYFIVPAWLRAPGAVQFLRRRLVRLLLPYWGSLLLIVALALIFKLARGVNDIAPLPHTGSTVAATLLLLTDPLTTVPRLNWVYWTLTPLLFYSIIAGLILFAPARARIPLLAGLHIALCTADLLLLPAGAGVAMLLKYWPMFGAGVALALRAAHRPLGTGLLVASVLHAGISLGLGHDDLYYAMTSLVTAAALAFAPSGPLPAWFGPLAGLGRSSYSLYLVHVPIGVYLLGRLLSSEPSGALALIGGQLALLAGSIAAAGLFYFACEKPSLRLGR